jgi:DNA-directed RNA polymerase alpha subunit
MAGEIDAVGLARDAIEARPSSPAIDAPKTRWHRAPASEGAASSQNAQATSSESARPVSDAMQFCSESEGEIVSSLFLRVIGEKVIREAEAMARFEAAGFSRRATNALVNDGIDEPARLLSMTMKELRMIPLVGKVLLAEIDAYRTRSLIAEADNNDPDAPDQSS